MRIATAIIIAFFVSTLVFSTALLDAAGGKAFLYGFITFIGIIILSRIKFGKDPDKMPNIIIKLQRYVPKVVDRRADMTIPAETYIPMLIPPEEVKLESFMSPPDGPKSNNSIAVAGQAGVGKTWLVRWLVEQDRSKHKIIFSFKEKDDYLYMGIPILDVSKTAPNPFVDIAAFSDAFITANPIESKGIQASSIKPRLLKLLAHSKTWKEFFEFLEVSEKLAVSKRDSNAAPVFALIRDQAEALATTPTHNTDITNYIEQYPELVLDFSQIKDKMAQTFYSEIILRQLWHADFYSRENPALLAIDEAHRLVGDKAQDSILVLILREGRSRGLKVIASTQRYTDIYDDAMSNFATQLMFHTNNKRDLDALPTEMLRHAVLELQRSFFVDANQPDLHTSVDVMFLNKPERTESSPNYIKIDQAEEQEVQQETPIPPSIDYEKEIYTILSTKGLSYSTELGKIIAEKYSIDKDKAKLGVKGALDKLKRNGDVASMPIRRGNTDIIAYYMTNANESGLHKGMIEEILNFLNKNRITVESVSKSGGKSSTDIETPDLNIEIETGLKHSKADLKERISKSKKHFVIVVPDEATKSKYNSLKSKQVDIVILGKIEEYLDKFKPKPNGSLARKK